MSGLRTDLYEVRMALSYLRHDMDEQATFSLFVRILPPERGFLVVAGLEDCLSFLEGFRFTEEELAYLRTELDVDADALRALAGITFTGDVRAVPEGRIVFAEEPLLEVDAPIAQAQLVETALLNLATFQTTVASKAARCRLAAPDADLVDFAFRRTHGIPAADVVARMSAIAGFTATSNLSAARRYGLRPAGTMAHSYVQAFRDEHAAFTAFARDFPRAPIFLVDTYDTLDGVRTAIRVIRELGLTEPLGIRLDSGDLAVLAAGARELLDDAGLPGVRIFASGGLDEYALADLVAAGAPIDAFGVGTRMGVSADAPSLDSAYKLVSYANRPVMKLSPGKATVPAAKQVYRVAGEPVDILALREEPAPRAAEPLLVTVMRAGRRVAPPEPLTRARARFESDLAWLPGPARRLREPRAVVPQHSRRLAELTARVGRQHAPRSSWVARP